LTTPNGPTPGESFFTEYLDEVVGPFVVVVGSYEYTLDAPAPTIGDLLDVDGSVFDMIDELCTETDVADDLLEHFESRPVSEAQAFVEAALDHWGLVDPPRDGFARVCTELDKFGDAIEYDLELIGVDLRDYVLGRRTWAQLMRYLAKMPVGGHYSAALAGDLELAIARAERAAADKAAGIKAPDKAPSLVGWTPELAKLYDLVDSQRATTHAVWGASTKFKGKGGKAPRPARRPNTADARVATMLLKKEHDEVAGAMLGKRYSPSYRR
jgi:hypothetical protein